MARSAAVLCGTFPFKTPRQTAFQLCESRRDHWRSSCLGIHATHRLTIVHFGCLGPDYSTSLRVPDLSPYSELLHRHSWNSSDNHGRRFWPSEICYRRFKPSTRRRRSPTLRTTPPPVPPVSRSTLPPHATWAPSPSTVIFQSAIKPYAGLHLRSRVECHTQTNWAHEHRAKPLGSAACDSFPWTLFSAIG